MELKGQKVYDKPLDIELFPETLEFRFGGAKISAFTRFKNPQKHLNTLQEIMGEGLNSKINKDGKLVVDGQPYIKVFYKTFTDTMGITPRAALKVMNSVGWKVIVEGFTNEQIFKYCYLRGYKRVLSKCRVESLHKLAPVVKQALADGQENLVPLILQLEKSPKEIKDSVPKYIWKKVINSSYTKNEYLGRAVAVCGGIGVYKEDNKAVLGYATLRTSTLQCFDVGYKSLDKLQLIEKLAVEKRVLSKPQDYRLLANKVFDTIHMAEQLGVQWNPKWKVKRWEEEHQRMSREIHAKRFSPDTITTGLYPRLPKEVVTPEGKATLLQSALDVAVEGNKMNHCVGGYAERCRSGRYAVYHITTKDGEESTLGCNMDNHNISFNQHYGYGNSHVSDAANRVRAAVFIQAGSLLNNNYQGELND